MTVAQLGSPASATANGSEDVTISSFTVPAGVNRLIVVGYAVRESVSRSTDNVTYDGNSLTEVATGSPQAFNESEVSFWYKALGSSASPTVADVVCTGTVNTPANAQAIAIAFVLQDVDQSAVVTASSGGTVTPGTSISGTINSDTTDLGVDVFCMEETTDWTADSGQVVIDTDELDGVAGEFHMSCSKEPGASPTIAMGWSGASANAGHIRMSVDAVTVAQLGDADSNTNADGPDVTISSFQVPAGNDRVLFVAFSVIGSTSRSTDSVTFGGAGLTEITPSSPEAFDISEVSYWYKAMGSGSADTQDIVCDGSSSGSDGSCAIAFVLENVNQTTPIIDNDSDSLLGTVSVEATVAAMKDSLVIDVFGMEEWDGWGPGTSQTDMEYVQFVPVGDYTMHCSRKAGVDGDVTMIWEDSISSEWVAIIAASVLKVGVPHITDMGDEVFTPYEENVTISGVGFGASQGTGNVYLADSATFLTANKITQVVHSWSDTSIVIRAVDPGTLFGSAISGDLWAFVETDGGTVTSGRPIFVGNRDVRVKTGTFTTPGSTGNYDVMIPGFEGVDLVKGVIFRGAAVTSEGTQVHATHFVGFADDAGTPNQSCVNIADEHNVTGDTRRARDGAKCLVIINADNDTPVVEATFSGSITGGFRLNFSTTASGYIVNYVAFGGRNVQATAGAATVSSGSVSGLSFRPELVFCATFGDQLGDPPGNYGTHGFGVFNDKLQEMQITSYNGRDGDRNDIISVGNDDGYLSTVSGDALTWEMSVTGINSDGWSWSGSDSDGFEYLALNLAGVGTYIGSFAKSTGAAPATQALPDFGFIPQAYTLMCGGRTSETRTEGDCKVTWGWFDSVRQNAERQADEYNVSPTNAHQGTDDAAVLTLPDVDGAIEAKAVAQWIGTDTSPDVVWNPNTATADIVLVCAIEVPEVPAGIGLDGVNA